MKYDNELFELSDYFKTVNKHEKDSKDIEIKKRKLFRLILDKFRQSKPEDGVFKVKFAGTIGTEEPPGMQAFSFFPLGIPPQYSSE